MFTTSKSETKYDEALDFAINELMSNNAHTDDYATILDRIGKLHKMRQDERPQTASPDTVLTVAANIAGILMIIHHERVNVITSKALGFVMKPR